MAAIDSAHQSGLHALTGAPEEAGRRCADARLAWTNEVKAPNSRPSRRGTCEYEPRAAAAESAPTDRQLTDSDADGEAERL